VKYLYTISVAHFVKFTSSAAMQAKLHCPQFG
jgi:hypothetical protein